MQSQSQPALKQPKRTITNVVVMGDSISDRGTMSKRHLLGFIPMKLILALTANNHKGRFTNGYTWDDDLGAMMAAGFLAQHFKQAHKGIHDNTDIADAIINHDIHMQGEIDQAFNLDNDRGIDYKDTGFIRTYCEGGLTAANYRPEHVIQPALEASRHMLATLEDKRKQIFADDAKANTTALTKEETLVIMAAGGNDLITVNATPTTAAADKAVLAIIDNAEKMYAAGYRNFALFTVPDLSLTPRFFAKSPAERANAQDVVGYFNRLLAVQAKLLQQRSPHLSIDMFDMNNTLNKVLAKPQDYGFDKDKIHTPFVTSEVYKLNRNGALTAPDYIFWDDIHPTAHTHAILAKEFYDQASQKYSFASPVLTNTVAQSTPALMYEKFVSQYRKKLHQDKQSFFGFFRRGNLIAELCKLSPLDGSDETYSRHIAQILNHALSGGGKRSLGILQSLGWLNENKQINVNLDVLGHAKQLLDDGLPDNRHLHRSVSAPELHAKLVESPQLKRTASTPMLRRS